MRAGCAVSAGAAQLDGLGPELVEAIADAVAARTVKGGLSVTESCDYLGVGWDFFREYVEPEIAIVRRGRRKIVPKVELDGWLDRNAHQVPAG